MSLANCIDKLVKLGKISAQTGERAKFISGEVSGRLGRDMPGSDADAIAALEAAKVMAKYAAEKRNEIARQVIASSAAMDRVMSHPHSRAAGAMSLFARDVRGNAKGPNVFSHSEVIEGELLKPMTQALEKYATGIVDRMKGLVGASDPASARNVIREIRGVNTGDANARELAAGWKVATDNAVKMGKAAGYIFNEKADWATPQFWSQGQARRYQAETFVGDVMAELDGGGLRLMKPDGSTATPLEREAIVRQAWDDIASGKSEAGGGAFTSTHRTFNFTMDETGAEAWIRLMEKYGPGQELVGMLRGHISRQARSIAMGQILGPQHGETVKAVAELVRKEEAVGKLSKFNPMRLFESAGAFEKSYKVASGAADTVESEVWSGIMGSLRGIHVAANMGSGIVSAVYSDPVTLMMTANFNGMSGGKIMSRAIADIAAESPKARAEIASTLNLVAHSISDVATGSSRFAEDALDKGTAAKLADIVVRAQGLEAWTQALKRAFTMEFMAYTARQADNAFDALDPAFQKFLNRYGFTPDEWEAIRATPAIEVEGARFFDHASVEDRNLGRRLMGAILDERGYAVLEPDIRVRQFTTGGTGRGNFWGEVGRSMALYKSFSMSMMLQHGTRTSQLLTEGGLAQGAAYAGPMLVALTLAGAAAIQTRQLITGKDPRDMTRWGFWGEAFAQGGGTGIYGDLINTAATRSNQGGVVNFFGPVASLADSSLKLTFGNLQQGVEGKRTGFGTELANTLKRWTPGSTLPYSRLATDRLIFDTIQSSIDPNYLQSWSRERQRLQKDHGQGFWWDRGEFAPERAPEFGTAFGGP